MICGAELFPVEPDRKINIHTSAVAFNPLLRTDERQYLSRKRLFLLFNGSVRIIANVFCRGRPASVRVSNLNQWVLHIIHRTIPLNSTHFLIFRLRDTDQVHFIAKTFCPKENRKFCFCI